GSLMEDKHFNSGTILDFNHQLLHQGIYIKKGGARVYYIEKGKEHTITFVFDDGYLPVRSTLNFPDTNIIVSFIEDTDVIYIPQSRIIEILSGASPESQVKVLKFVNAMIAQVTRELESRLFHLLHSTATDRYNWAINRYPRLIQSATISQIASFLGLSRETVTRIRSGHYKQRGSI
ncbi:MAG: Crp/Fnr family transcriptional regulator, partial [Muribaculum sp.]|nr:Crp/Fnr family transcriptional regulator [Muribaculum sp.]